MHPPHHESIRSVGAILGSAMDDGIVEALSLAPTEVQTPFGPQTLFEGTRPDGIGMRVLYRHGFPHTHLPHTINFRAQIWALRARGCEALVLNSSVGVLDPALPLFTPMLATDLLMPENRLPDGSLCTLFTAEAMAESADVRAQAGHLVLSEGIFSLPLARQLRALGVAHPEPGRSLVFVYAPGPRTKTPAENRYWAALGGHVNSMSLGPEAVLAAEAGIPCAALVVGHKPSTGHGVAGGAEDMAAGGAGAAAGGGNLTREALTESLDAARAATEAVLLAFLREGKPVSTGNLIYRF